MMGKPRQTTIVTFFFLLFGSAGLTTSYAADLNTLQSVAHGGVVITEGDTITRSDLLSVNRFWIFSFSWPQGVPSSQSFLGVFRGTFGELEGGAVNEGVNYDSNSNSWPSGSSSRIKSINIPALGELDTTSSIYTAVVAELVSTSTHAQTAEWFASGGISGVEPVNYSLLTFTYDSTDMPENLDSMHFVEHGGKQIMDGDQVFRDDFSFESSFWTFNFDWPRRVPNNRAMLSIFRGTFGNLDGGTPLEFINYSSQVQVWSSVNPVSVAKSLPIFPPIGNGSTTDSAYTLMVAERDPKYVDGAKGFHTDDQVLWFASGGTDGIAPKAYSLLEFDYKQEPLPTIDPLILQYEPILYLHPEENYQPMNVEAFIEASSLWDDNGILPDTLIKGASLIDPVTVDDIAVAGSEDWYLQFSGDNSSPKSFDPLLASSTYNALVADGKATTTYYARKMEDSFVDSNDLLREFIVLQYWYFYAFNDWLEHGGRNNHEGDWESVFIFLDKETETPQYVAYSSHLNDGEPDTPFQYDSVRRAWDSNEVEKDSDQLKSFVALGSHANYPNNGNSGIHNARSADDNTSVSGDDLGTNSWIIRKAILGNTPEWMTYEGKWGADNTDVTGGSDGPKGPNFFAPFLGGGVARFHNPIEWAGIDNIRTDIVNSPIDRILSASQFISIFFTQDLQPGTEISIDLHDELISFGSNTNEVNFLPHFWNIESSLVNNTFNAIIEFQYNPDELALLGINENNLSVFLYNDTLNTWETVPAILNTQISTISAATTHFSRYALGAHRFEDVTENVEVEVDWEDFEDGIREVEIEIEGEDGFELSGDFRLLITNLEENIFLVNNTGTTTEGAPYIDITESKHRECDDDEYEEESQCTDWEYEYEVTLLFSINSGGGVEDKDTDDEEGEEGVGEEDDDGESRGFGFNVEVLK